MLLLLSKISRRRKLFFYRDLKRSSSSECFMAAITDHKRIFLLVSNKHFYSQREFKDFRFTLQTNHAFSASSVDWNISIRLDDCQSFKALF